MSNFSCVNEKSIASITSVNTVCAIQRPVLCRLTLGHAVPLSRCSTLSRVLSPAKSSSTEAAKATRTVTVPWRNACPIVLGKTVGGDFMSSCINSVDGLMDFK